MIGTEQWVLVEGRSTKHEYELFGRTDSHRIINFPVPPHAIERLLGQKVSVKVVSANSHTLRGELVIE
jgi:tRNA A37 methylthiotransferase MiaB